MQRFESIAVAVAVAMSAATGAGCSSEPPASSASPRAPVAASAASLTQDDDDCASGEALAATPEIREHASRPVAWTSPDFRRGGRPPVPVKILGFNDFHGQITTARKVAGRLVGGAAVLASYLKAATTDPSGTLIVHAGDHVGASPPESALLQDEPAIDVLNALTNAHCRRDFKLDPECNVIGTLGNHEFDEGRAELVRLLEGGNFASGPFVDEPYRGAKYPMISANVVDAKTNLPILPPFAVKIVHGIPIGFVGAVLKDTPSIVVPSGVAGLRFLDEAETINAYVRVLRFFGVRSIVVLLHQGGTQPSYTGETDAGAGVAPTGAIADIVSKLDDDVDLVVSGHTHAFTNAIVRNANGAPILVTQAFSYSTAFADIDLAIDPSTRDVVAKSARVVTTYADEGPGLTPDATVKAIVDAAQARVAPLVNRVVGTASGDITRTQSTAGESPLGDLIADAQRAALKTDFAFMNPGGIRTDVAAGTVTWGALFSVQPFGNTLTKITLTGQGIVDVLNQQWSVDPSGRFLQVAGLTYAWDAALPVGSRIVSVAKDGAPIDPAASYTVTVNNFLATGGDGFTAFTKATSAVVGPTDLDALVAYVQGLPQPFGAPQPPGRIVRLH